MTCYKFLKSRKDGYKKLMWEWFKLLEMEVKVDITEKRAFESRLKGPGRAGYEGILKKAPQEGQKSLEERTC